MASARSTGRAGFRCAAILCFLAAVSAVPASSQTRDLRIAAYNIRHGAGMDGQVDLVRIAEVLRALAVHELQVSVGGAGPVSVVSVHLAGSVDERAAQADSVSRYFADTPDREIDFVMLRPGRAWEVVEHRVVAEDLAADHRPILVVLRSAPG